MTWSLASVDDGDRVASMELTVNAVYRLETDEEESENWAPFSFRLDPSVAMDVAPYQPPAHTSDPAVAKLVRSWLQNCCQTHKYCCLDQDPAYRPPRLLHITPSGVRLVDGRQCPEGSGWTTLSHCWGRNPTFLRLTASNLSSFQEGIPMRDLPRTFHDAVVLCECIGSQFLWIDSLCILQAGDGSKQDWLHHTNAMRAIYRNAQLNIAAEWAESSSAGLFKSRHPACVDRPLIMFRAGSLKGAWKLTLDSEFGSPSSNAPLRKRGWVVQERMLSPRIVRFCSDFVRWQCRESLFHRSERYPDGHAPVATYPKVLRLPYPSVAEKQALLTNEAYRSFVDVAHLYSHTALTYPDLDKFPAFAGLAEHYSLLFKDQYIAGFLKGHLPRALGWVRDRWGTEEETNLTKPDAYRAPSWSWAALDCRTFASRLIQSSMDADVRDTIDLCQMVSHRIVPRDERNSYGQLEYASLTLRARLSLCMWSTEEASLHQKVQLPDLPVSTDPFITFDTIADFHTAQDQTKVIAIGGRQLEGEVIGLLLHRVEQSEPPTYRRIGQCIIDGQDLITYFNEKPWEVIVLV